MAKHREFAAGFGAALPLGVSIAAFGAVLGVLAVTKGLGLGALLLMGVTVFAGTAQFVVLDLWSETPPLAEIVLATLIVNTRYALICASLRPVLGGLSLARRLATVHLVADENWALTMAAHRRGEGGADYLLGAGAACLASWLAGNALGYLLGGHMPRPEVFGLDFAFVAAYFALALALRRDNRDLVPWAVAAAVAVAVAETVPGNAYIVAGSVCGVLTAAFMPVGTEDV